MHAGRYSVAASVHGRLALFDYRRYEAPSSRLALAAKRALLFTDARLSPISIDADVVLRSETGSVSAFDAMTRALTGALVSSRARDRLAPLRPASRARRVVSRDLR